MLNTPKRNIYFTISTIFITLLILGYLVYSQREFIFNNHWQLDLNYIGIAFLIYSLILLLNVLTWTSILNNLGAKINFVTHFRSTTISALGKRLPGTLWYVWWRAEIYKDKFSTRIIAFASAIEMAVTVVAAVIICAVFASRMIIQYQYSILGILVLLIVSLGLMHPKIIRWILLKMHVENLEISYRKLAIWILTYMIIWVLVGVLLFNINNIFVVATLDNIGYFIGSIALTGTISRLLLFSPSVFGFTEVSLSLLLSNIMPSSLAVIVAIANRIIITIFEILWALISLLISGYSVPKPSFRS